MKSKNPVLFKVMQVLCWIVFIGCTVQTGIILFSLIFSLIKPAYTNRLMYGADLLSLRNYDVTYYIIMYSLLTILCGLRALMFYFVLNLFLKINLVNPFSEKVGAIIKNIGAMALLVGLLAKVMGGTMQKLANDGVNLNLLAENTSHGSDYLFFAGILFVISMVFAKGIELQSENELTI